MAQNKVFQYYQELPPWAKGVVVVGGGLVAYLVLRRVYNAVFPSKEERRNQALTQNVNSEIRNMQSQGVKPSFADSQYDTFANTIYNGMRYCVGDDYGTVEVTLKKMKNDLDVAKLLKAFGNRQDYCFGIPASGKLDLFTYVQKELGNEWGGLTNYRVRNINADWKKKGITYQI
jgi:hypothetical protein